MTWDILLDNRPLVAVSPRRMQKTAGLFLRPSDLADHRGLAAALEQQLNGAGQGTQFKVAAAPTRLTKTASISRAVDTTIGALGGLAATNRLMNRTLTAPSPIEPPQQPKGVLARLRGAYNSTLDSASTSARTYPVTSYLVGAAAGAVGGATSNARVYDRLRDVLRS
jgi:hypothetical protein